MSRYIGRRKIIARGNCLDPAVRTASDTGWKHLCIDQCTDVFNRFNALGRQNASFS